MDPEEILTQLEQAGNDPVNQILLCVYLAYPDASEKEQNNLRFALKAAAIPHWFDVSILGKLLDITDEKADEIVSQLKSLSVIEPFPARGLSTFNVHEKSRLTLRRHLQMHDSTRFRQFSARASALFTNSTPPHEQIERLYHRLVVNPDDAIQELEKLYREWILSAPP